MLLRARPSRRLGTLLGAVALTAALSVSSAALPAFATKPHTAATVRGADVPKTTPLPELILAPVQAALLSNDDSADFELWIDNPTDTEFPAGRVVLALDPTRVTAEAGLAAEFPAGEDAPLIETTSPAVPAGEGRLLTLSVPRAEWPLTTASDAGVYRVLATLTPEVSDAAAADTTTNTGPLSAVSALVWRGAGGLTRVQLTTVVPMLLPESVQSLPRRGQLDELMGPGSRLDDLLTIAETRGATLAIDPRVVAGVRVYGSSASAASRSFVDRLDSTSAPSFALQFADADPSAQAALGFSRLLGPDGLSFASRFGQFPQQDPDPTQPTSADATGGAAGEPTDADQAAADAADAADPAAQADAPLAPADTDTDTPADATTDVPGISELITWNTSLPGTAWPAADSITSGVVELLERNNYSRVLASADNVAVTGGGARGVANGVEYLVSDDVLDAAALTALSADTETGRLSGVALTSALLVLRAQADVPGVVLTFDRRETPESNYAAELINTLSALPWVEPATPDELPEATAILLPAAQAATSERTEALRDATVREPLVRDYSRVLVAPENLIDLQRVRLLQLFSARLTVPGTNFDAAAARSFKRDAETLDGVRVVTSTHTQLVGASSRVPVQVRNTLPFDALLVAHVVPTNGALIVTESSIEAALIPSDSSANILVPVRTRVSSGESGLAVELSAASGGEVVTSGLLDISIRSSWETLVLGGLGLLTAGFFGLGIWRSIRRRSRASAESQGIVEP